MLTGRAAFAGDTVSDTIVRILERDPDWSALPARRAACASARPARDAWPRTRRSGCATSAMRASRSTRPARSYLAGRTPTSARPTSAGMAAWVALAALATAVAIREGVRDVPPNDPFAGARFTPITDWEGTESAADISPDGRFVTFVADPDGQFDRWWTQIGTGQFSRLGTPQKLMPRRIPEGIRVLRRRSRYLELAARGPLGPTALLALTGGPPRPLLALRQHRAVVVARRRTARLHEDRPENGRRVVRRRPHRRRPARDRADRAGCAQPQPRVVDRRPMDLLRAWRHPDRHDGHHGRLARQPQGRSTGTCHARESHHELPGAARCAHIALCRSVEDLSGPWLWAVDLDRKNARPRRLTLGVEQYTSVAASRDGRRVVATVANPTSSLWRVPLRDSGVDERDAEPYAVPADHASAPRFGGGSLFYSATSGGSAGLWRLRDGQPLPIRTGSEGAIVDAAAVTRDGARVIVVASKRG